MEDGTIHDYPFGYEKYRAVKERQQAQRQPSTAPKAEKKEKKERPVKAGGTKALGKLVKRLEREIEAKETQIAELDGQIEAAASDYQKLAELLQQRQQEEGALATLMERWEQGAQELEESAQ